MQKKRQARAEYHRCENSYRNLFQNLSDDTQQWTLLVARRQADVDVISAKAVLVDALRAVARAHTASADAQIVLLQHS